MLSSLIKRLIVVAMLSSIAMVSFAEDNAAPVYDADNMPPSFDNQADASAMPPPPPPQAMVQPQQAPEVPQESFSPPPQSLTVEQRVARTEQQINHLENKNASSKVEALQTEVQSLRGQVESLTHQVQQLQTQQRAMFTDLDKRMTNLSKVKPQKIAATFAVDETDNTLNDEQPADTVPVKAVKKQRVQSASADAATASNSTLTVAAKKSDSQPNVAEEQQIYQTAYNQIKARRYNDAISALQKMLQKYPSGQFAANAHYWLGELYNLTGKNNEAAGEFDSVVKSFPESPKVSDAQLKLGLIYAGQFKWNEAKAAFKKVINSYPGTASAHLASEQLKQLRQAGH